MMAGNRKAAEAYCLDLMEKLVPGSGNRELYAARFKAMNDEQFEAFITGLDNGTVDLAVIVPNLKPAKLNVKRLLGVAKEMGHEPFERLWMGGGNTGIPRYLTPKKYLIIDQTLRRQAQLLVKKISIPQDSKSVDDLTGQPTGASKGSKMSYPQIQVMAALGMDRTLEEFLKYRGGDLKGFNAMMASVSRTGGVSLDAIEPLAGGVQSTQTLSVFLTCMHIDSTLLAR